MVGVRQATEPSRPPCNTRTLIVKEQQMLAFISYRVSGLVQRKNQPPRYEVGWIGLCAPSMGAL
jgi:hypothetical protein